jgi:hypothetical protein
MTLATAISGLALAACTMVAGCGDNLHGCVPGEQRACGCAGGASGAQVCNAAGTAFGSCAGCQEAAPIACDAQTDCPVGFDCGLARPSDASATCYRPAYVLVPGGFGTSCALTALGCTTQANPCAPGYACEAEVKCDPAAVCTATCGADPDCPPTMFCGTTAAGKRRCLVRQSCSRCVVDDQCGDGARCATDARGERYCARACTSDADCPPPQANEAGMAPQPFEQCVADAGGKGLVCQPSNGFCHGPSALASQVGDGQLCSGCRVGEPADCAVGTCFDDAFSTERFCSQACTIDYVWNGSAYDVTDRCPSGTYCFHGSEVCAPPGDCSYPGECGGDPTRTFLTCYP